MNNDEAKYLIDQFNKYISWRVVRWNYHVAASAILVAIFTTVISLSGIPSEINVLITSSPTSISLSYLQAIALGLSVGLGAFVVGNARKYFQEIRAFKEHLLVMEDYRSKHKDDPDKALPDGITLRLVIENPDGAERVLEASETVPAYPTNSQHSPIL